MRRLGFVIAMSAIYRTEIWFTKLGSKMASFILLTAMILCRIGDMQGIIVYLVFIQWPQALSEFNGVKVTGPPG
jgi:hypothetical protein